nr:hypothetical protein [Tanacetum cinerariifolium]
MENYNRETARNWKLKFPKEDEGNTHDIKRMRVRFAAKMVSHEINIHCKNISKEVVKFAKCYNDKKKREALILEAIKTKKQNQDSERVARTGTWYAGEPRWDCSELGGFLVVEGLLRIASLSHATYPERKCFPTRILV